MRLRKTRESQPFLALPDRRPHVQSPFVVVVDQREKAPYTFQGITQGARDGRRIIDVRREWRYLGAGDYSIAGYEGRVAIERKSLPDLLSTLGQHRDRFERELQRLSTYDFAAVVIESSWRAILLEQATRGRSRLNPTTVWRTSMAWAVRYGVHWLAWEDRRLAEIGTYRILEKWWSEQERRKSGETEKANQRRR